MTIVTNNVHQGLMDGVGNGTGSGFVPAGVMNVGVDDPSDVVVAQTGSDVFFDAANDQYYMALCSAGGSTWIKLGSSA